MCPVGSYTPSRESCARLAGSDMTNGKCRDHEGMFPLNSLILSAKTKLLTVSMINEETPQIIGY